MVNMDYYKISKEIVSHLYDAHTSFANSPLSKQLRLLLEIRVSQINGCSYCINLHQNEAIASGIDEKKISDLENVSGSEYFNEAEQEALIWAENVTKLKTKVRVKNSKLDQYFSEREIVDITLCVSLMNAFNRIAITMRDFKK